MYKRSTKVFGQAHRDKIDFKIFPIVCIWILHHVHIQTLLNLRWVCWTPKSDLSSMKSVTQIITVTIINLVTPKAFVPHFCSSFCSTNPPLFLTGRMMLHHLLNTKELHDIARNTHWRGKLNSYNLIKVAYVFCKNMLMFAISISISKVADLNFLFHGGQLYLAFSFSKGSLLYVLYFCAIGFFLWMLVSITVTHRHRKAQK